MDAREQEQDDFDILLNLLEIDEISFPDLLGALSSPSFFYRSFFIQKRTGGLRKIDSPFPSLQRIQRSILLNVLSRMEIHPAAHAFVQGRNALGHASCHLRGNELLTLDIKDFFPSVTRQMVFQALNSRGLTNGLSHYISILCCLNDRLPQGACTSPLLSNLVFSSLDERLHRLAKSQQLVYSRYADDLAFSGERVPRNLTKVIQEILFSMNFSLNEKKIRLKISGAKKIVTGVSISTGVPKVPKKFKRELRAKIFSIQKHEFCLANLPLFEPLVYEKALGKINYLLQIEPNNEYARRKKRELSRAHRQFLSLAPKDSA